MGGKVCGVISLKNRNPCKIHLTPSFPLLTLLALRAVPVFSCGEIGYSSNYHNVVIGFLISLQ